MQSDSGYEIVFQRRHSPTCMVVFRFRLIPGDLCQDTEESKKLLKKVEKVCKGHEDDAGDYPENRRGGVS